MVCRITCSITEIKARLAVLAFLNDRIDFCFFHPLGTTTFQKITKTDLEVTLASSFGPHGYIPPGPMDLCMFSFF